MNVADVLSRSAHHYSDKPIFYFHDQPTSFSAFHADIGRAQAILRTSGAKKSDRVAILASNKPEWLACYFAILSIGAVIVPINPALTPHEVAYIIEDSAPVLAFVDQALAETLSMALHKPHTVTLPSGDGSSSWETFKGDIDAKLNILAVDPEHPSVIYYTSGTTGRPKGAIIPHRGTLRTMQGTADWYSFRPSDIIVIPGSFAFIMHSTFAAGSHICAGASIVIQERFHPKMAIDAIERYRASVVIWVPTMYVIASEYAETHGSDLSSLRTCTSGGAPLPWPVVERFHKVSGTYILSSWGMSEGTPATAFDPSGPGRPESIGKELPDCKVRVIDDAGNEAPLREIGELIYTSPSHMIEYLNRPEETADTLRNGWIHSGDLGWRDEDGFLYIVGRKKDMIIRGGAKVYPAEVEEIVIANADVAETAVVGAPDPRYGEKVVAFVTARDGRQPTPESLREHCARNLAEYKIPQEFIVVGDLPRGPTGKILKRVLRDQLATPAAQSA